MLFFLILFHGYTLRAWTAYLVELSPMYIAFNEVSNHIIFPKVRGAVSEAFLNSSSTIRVFLIPGVPNVV